MAFFLKILSGSVWVSFLKFRVGLCGNQQKQWRREERASMLF